METALAVEVKLEARAAILPAVQIRSVTSRTWSTWRSLRRCAGWSGRAGWIRVRRLPRSASCRSLDLERHAHEPLLDRVWALRRNLTAHDAVYVALAEALDADLLTCDARLARAPGMAARVELVE